MKAINNYPEKLSQIICAFFFTVLFVACNGKSEKKSDVRDHDPIAATSSDTVTKKEKSIDPGKSSTTKWIANAAQAEISFSVKGPCGTVHGSLSDLKSTILFDADNLASSFIKASVDPKSISTGIRLRNRDLQKEKYLNSDTYPSISFQSSAIEKSASGYKATGKLTIKGVTKTVIIPFNFTRNGNAGV